MKKGYYEYDSQIYPRKLWVHIGRDIEDLKKLFNDLKIEEEDYLGVTFDNVVRKSNCDIGVLVSFKSPRDMRMSVIAHESSHAVDSIEEAIGMEHGGEASAYLMGWVAACINKARLGLGDFIELDQNE